MNGDLKLDCRNYVGTKPCAANRLCEGCPHYEPVGRKILIIKLAAMGDVLRTTPLLRALKSQDPNCHITWVADRASIPLLQGNPMIDRLLPMDIGTALRMEVETFDLALCLDKEDAAIGLVEKARAAKKMGFGLDPSGSIRPLNPEAWYAFSLGLSDELKFVKNTRTYQDFTFESVGLTFAGEEYVFALTDKEREKGFSRLRRAGWRVGRKAVGLNTGAGPVFATKKWTIDGFVELARLAHERLDSQIVILGGPEEVERNREIINRLGPWAIDAGCDNPLRIFAAMLSHLDLVVTGDTLAMHLCIAQKAPVIALFGPTCGQEVELYCRGEKLVGRADCMPCYRSSCDDVRCLKSISAQRVFESVELWLAGGSGRTP